MYTRHLFLGVSTVFIVVAFARAADEAPVVQAAQGVVDKVEKDSLTIKPRGKDGRFEKAVVLKLTGTSKISTLSTQMRGKATIFVQKETDSKELQPNQPIALVYATGQGGTVLLTAVVLPATAK
jgi:hypothetical protein